MSKLSFARLNFGEIEICSSESTPRISNSLQKSEKNNLVIHGASLDNQSPRKTAVNIFRDVMNVATVAEDLDDAYTLGKEDESPILVELISFNKKNEILKRTNTLNGTGIYITLDISPEQRIKQSILIKYMKEARNKGQTSRIRGDNLIVDGKAFKINQHRTPDCSVDSDVVPKVTKNIVLICRNLNDLRPDPP
ncbi:hypothetical protein HHI36_014314 [Cryptolaemus montrouzieri]|uniref:Uncharacterized protein n=1 Tax=Cryptolaemus montrouzieri TaxID=559131 RepID=A0ABD2N250_9CUCU